MKSPYVLATLLATLTAIAGGAAPPALDAATRKDVVEALAAALDAHYVSPQPGQQMAQVVRSKLAAGDYDRIALSGELADALTTDIRSVVDDRHLKVRLAPPGPPPGFTPRAMSAVSDARGGIEEAKVLAGNIGYLSIRGELPLQSAAEPIAAAFASLHDTDALIIDLRTNGGGSPETVALYVSYLSEGAPRVISRVHYREAGAAEVKTTDLGTLSYGTHKPVFVLTSHNTISAGEAFAYDLQSSRRAVIVGEVTAGAANPGDYRPLGHGLVAFVPAGYVANALTGGNWEGVGVMPDAEVPQEQALLEAQRRAVARLQAQPATRDEVSHKMTDGQIVQDLRTRLDRLAAEDKFSGAVLLAKGDKILFEHAYGLADHAFNAPNKVDTKFNLGSMGKMFTGVAILQLVQEGKLSLEAKLIDVVPDYPDRDIARKITIHQLLTHTSGLGDMFNERFEATPREQLVTIQAYLPLFTGKPLLFEPGTRWQYSNAGYIVLGLVIEKVSGQSYYDYVREHIFKLAGMGNTDNYEPHDDVSNLALGYTTARGAPPGARRITNAPMRGASAGGGYSTVEDLLRFSRALQGLKLLNKEYTDLDMTGKIASGRGTSKYAFGMQEDFINGVRIVGHGGGAPGISSNLDMYPDLGYTVAIMTNYDGAASFANGTIQLELTGRGLPRAIHLPPEILQSFAGEYALALPPGAPPFAYAAPMELSAAKGWLLYLPDHRFRPLSPNEFFDDENPNARIIFTKDAQGRVTQARLAAGMMGPAPIRATRQP
jgi:CubicO group peptidase (beta-lactamase class C family)